MRVRSLSLACVLVTLFIWAIPAPSSAQSEELFEAGTLHDVRLLVNARDLQELRERYLEDIYYPADLLWNGRQIRNVGIRSRGSATRNPVKPGLRVDFNRYVDGQTFMGLNALALDNLYQDPSMLHERVAMALFARMGQAVPREALCRLFINDEYQGVYALVELVDKTFLARSIGDDSGYLFEYQRQREFYGEYLGDSVDPYAETFEAETHESQPTSVLYGPIQEMFREINAEDDSLWEERVSAYLDLRQFITQAALDACVANIDGLLAERGMNNFFLYRPANTNQHRPFPWDIDQGLDVSDLPLLSYADRNAIFRRAFARAGLRTLFLDVLEQCARSAMQNNWLVTEIEMAAQLIADAAHADPRKPFSNQELDAGLDRLRAFARQRPAFVLREVGALRGR